MTIDEVIEYIKTLLAQRGGRRRGRRLLGQIAEWLEELKVTRKALELMAESLFGSDCDHKYHECSDLRIYMHPCQKCIDCIVNDYLEEARENDGRD